MQKILSLALMLCAVLPKVHAQNADFSQKKRPNATQPLAVQPLTLQPTGGTAPAPLLIAAQQPYPTLRPQVLAGLYAQNISYSAAYGTINYANFEHQTQVFSLVGSDQQRIATDQVLRWLALNPSDFVIKTIETDELGYTHIKLQQVFGNVNIFGSEAYMHFKNNKAHSFNGAYYPPVRVLAQGRNTTIMPEQSVQIAKKHLELSHTLQDLTQQTFALVPVQPQTEKIVYFDEKLVPCIAYHHTIFANILERFEYFVDANTGEILAHYSNTCAFADGPFTAQATDLNNQQRTVNTYKVGANYYFLDGAKPMFSLPNSTLPNDPKGAIWTVDAAFTYGNNLNISQIANTTNAWNNPKAVSAHYNGETAYNYYKNTFNRNAIDAQGNNIISVINVNDPDSGQGMDNAYWNGYAMFYGNGAQAFKPLAGGLDVAGHEMTHGVVQSTANLLYQGESGAINESMADVFGAMIDPNDWLIGEDVVKTAAFPSGALRSLQDPHNGGSSLNSPGYQPRIMSEKYTGAQDNGGVHINSGIPNWAFYKFATNANVGKTKAQAVYYRALTNYLTRSSTFADLRVAVVQAATDLHGAGSPEVAAANQAFTDVGIGSAGGGNTHQNNINTNPGTEFLLSTDTDPANTQKLYLSTPQGTGFAAISTTNPANRPSTQDNGTKAVFIGIDKKMRLITLNATTPNEQIIQSQPVWNSAAISKDGTKIAATTTPSDTSIYVFDLITGNSSRFKIYSPTFTQGVNSGTAIAADVIEWDYTGRYLIYDCYNEIQGQSGTTREYWDVNFMDVWSSTTNTFGTGQITSLFGSLPEGISIGDPSFAKNSPYILAFDYIDQSTATSTYTVIGVNIETNEAQVIAANNTVGYPTYGKLDNAVYYTKNNTATNKDIAKISVDNTKIAGTGTATTIVQYGKFAVIYANGTRQLPTATQNIAQNMAVNIYPNPNNTGVLYMDFGIEIMVNDLKIYNTLGNIVLTQTIDKKHTKLPINIASLPQGVYMLQATTKQGMVRSSIVVR